MTETVFYSSGAIRIEVIKIAPDWFFWRLDTDALSNEEHRYGPWRGLGTLEDVLIMDAAGEHLTDDDAAFSVSRDQAPLADG